MPLWVPATTRRVRAPDPLVPEDVFTAEEARQHQQCRRQLFSQTLCGRLIIRTMVEAALILDTHADIQELVASGMPEPQAETVVRQHVRLLERNVATKADIAATNTHIETLRQETKADIETLRQETKAHIETLRQETKADIETLRQETKAHIETLRQETEKLIALSKNDIIRWVVGANLGFAALVIAAIKLI